MSFIERFIIQCPYYRRSTIGGSAVHIHVVSVYCVDVHACNMHATCVTLHLDIEHVCVCTCSVLVSMW